MSNQELEARAKESDANFNFYTLDLVKVYHRSINTKKVEAGCWQARLTGCVLGNTVACQLKKARGQYSKKR